MTGYSKSGLQPKLGLGRFGSNLSPNCTEQGRKPGGKLQSQPRRINNMELISLVRDQGVAGSNPVSPTNLFKRLQAVRFLQR